MVARHLHGHGSSWQLHEAVKGGGFDGEGPLAKCGLNAVRGRAPDAVLTILLAGNTCAAAGLVIGGICDT